MEVGVSVAALRVLEGKCGGGRGGVVWIELDLCICSYIVRGLAGRCGG